LGLVRFSIAMDDMNRLISQQQQHFNEPDDDEEPDEESGFVEDPTNDDCDPQGFAETLRPGF